MTTKPIDTDRLIGNPIIADRLKSYFASYEKPDIIKALEEIGGWHEARDGRKVFRFENEIDNPILEDVYYVSSYPYNGKVLHVFIGYEDADFYVTEGEMTTK